MPFSLKKKVRKTCIIFVCDILKAVQAIWAQKFNEDGPCAVLEPIQHQLCQKKNVDEKMYCFWQARAFM
jgi:hypothetical protein